MRLRVIGFAFVCALTACSSPQTTQVTQVIAPAPAPPPAVSPAPAAAPANPITRLVALSGVPHRVDFVAIVNPDCSSAGLSKVSLATNPSHGSVSIKDTADYTNFPANNQRYPCNKQKSPGVVTDYTAAPGYAGLDTFTLSIILPSGTPVQHMFIVNVQPHS